MRMDYGNVLKNVKSFLDEQVRILDSFGLCLAATTEADVGKKFELPNDMETIKSKNRYLYVNISSAFDSPILMVEHVGPESKKVIQLIQMMIANQHIKKGKEDYLNQALTGELTEEEIQYVQDMKYFGFLKSPFRVVSFDLDGVDQDAVIFIAKQLFEDQTVFNIANHLILISNQNLEGLLDQVKMFLSEVDSEIMVSIKGAVGKPVEGIGNLKEAFTSSLRTFELGNLLHEEKFILIFEDLMIPFMLDALDDKLVKDLINPIEDAVDDVFEDEELVMTMTQFFLNDLNITETARNLFVHRNTLIYRLSKIEKMTGMDLKKFEDAVKLYLILYIKRKS